MNEPTWKQVFLNGVRSGFIWGNIIGLPLFIAFVAFHYAGLELPW